MTITTHTLVRNEENWIWFSLMSVKDHVSAMIVYDDNSTDNTQKIVKEIDDPKIKYTNVYAKSSSEHTALRNKMINETQTEWFMLLDGDEIWNETTIEKFLEYVSKVPSNINAVALRTRNCIGDVYHYLPENSGKYEILGHKGHLNIRAYRKIFGYRWYGDYPLEYYGDVSRNSINSDSKQLAFFDDYYWHMTNLPRSSKNDKVKGWRKTRIEKGIKPADKKMLPEVFFESRPKIVPDPLQHRSILYEMESLVLSPFKTLKRNIKV